MHKSLSENDIKREIRRIKIVNYTIFSIFLILFIAIIVCCLLYRYQHTFSPDKWLNNPTERTDIINDLLQSYELIGLTEAEILSLLGSPNNDYCVFNANNRYVYYLGPERLFSIDSEWLLVDFIDGVVSDYSLAID